MTISKKHPLKNSGAKDAKDYFDKMFGKAKPKNYRAVLVVPEDFAAIYKAQKFEGKVNKKVVHMGHHLDQWVMGLP